jgi:hypothetical protein
VNSDLALVLQVLLVEKEQPMPHILSGARAIGGPVIGEESVAGIGVYLILVSLVVLV